MLVTNVGDEMRWRQLSDVGDGFDRFRHQHPLFLNISDGHQTSKDVTNIVTIIMFVILRHHISNGTRNVIRAAMLSNPIEKLCYIVYDQLLSQLV